MKKKLFLVSLATALLLSSCTPAPGATNLTVTEPTVEPTTSTSNGLSNAQGSASVSAEDQGTKDAEATEAGAAEEERYIDFLKDSFPVSCGRYEMYFTKKWTEDLQGFLPVYPVHDIGEGLFSTQIADFDKDGQKEMLTIEVVDGTASSGEACKGLRAIMNEIENEQVVAKDRAMLLQRIELSSQEGGAKVFMKEIDGKPFVFCETMDTAWLGDGYDYGFTGLSYENGTFTTVADVELRSPAEEDTQEALQALSQLGLTSPSLTDLSSFYDKGIAATEENVVPLCEIAFTFSYVELGYEQFAQEYDLFLGAEDTQLKPIVVTVNDYSEFSTYVPLGRRSGWTYEES